MLEVEPRTGAEVVLPDLVPGAAGMLAGPANVIMQLSWPAVGHGVVESRVDSGKVTKHPLKRTRTTFTYLAVATMGTDEERAIYRRAVNRSHALVRSEPDSPVAYNAFDPELQRWVAACLYWGAADLAERFSGPLDDATADALYDACSAFGTALQVPADMWPADRAAFAAYWEASLERVSIDRVVGGYLTDLTMLKFLPAPLRWLQGRENLFWTTGFLPEPFRTKMGFAWTEHDQRRFDRRIRRMRAVTRHLPRALHRFPFNWFLWDFRMRVRFNRRLV